MQCILIVSIHLPLCPPPHLTPNFMPSFLIINPWVQLVLPIWTWVWGQPWDIGNRPEVMPLKESDSPSFRNHLEPIFPPPRTEPQWPLPLCAGILTGLILCQSCASNQFAYQFIAVVKRNAVLWREGWAFPPSRDILQEPISLWTNGQAAFSSSCVCPELWLDADKGTGSSFLTNPGQRLM